MVTAVNRATVRLRHNEMDYFTFGTGSRPFVMLPGLSVKSMMQSAEGIASAYRRFAADFTVYCFDRTKFLKENYTVEQLAEDTAEAMTALHLQNACVFGACARLNPTAEAVMAKWVSLARRGDINAFCDSFTDVLYGRDFAQRFGEFIKIAHQDVTQADFDRFIILGKSCDTLNTYDRLDEIRCPVLVLGAEDDRVLTAQASVEIAGRIGCPCYLYGSEYGHCAFDEAPDYKDRMLSFFSKNNAIRKEVCYGI